MNRSDPSGTDGSDKDLYLYAMKIFLEEFLEKYIKLDHISKIDVKYTSRYLLKSKVNYITKNKKKDKNGRTQYHWKRRALEVKYGYKEHWEALCTSEIYDNLYSYFNFVAENAANNIGADSSGGATAGIIAVALVGLIASYLYANKQAKKHIEIYDKVWGENGLDPKDRLSYMVFYIKGADDMYVDKNGHHAYSYTREKGVKL